MAMTYKRILVPLDGSVMAEQILPYATSLARLLDAQLVLVQIVDSNLLIADKATRDSVFFGQVVTYMEKTRDIIINPEYAGHLEKNQVEFVVGFGSAGKQIVEVARAEKTDLVVMTSHAYSGFGRLILGSVAAQIIEHAQLPVMLVKPLKTDENSMLQDMLASSPNFFESKAVAARLLVTLDGSTEAELALEAAKYLARQMTPVATLHLLRVEEPATPMISGAAVSGYGLNYEANSLLYDVETRSEEAYHYLEQLSKDKPGEQDLTYVKTVQVGSSADEIVKYATKIEATLVIMTTHARGRLRQAVLGSVAQKVTRDCHLPVLLIHQSQVSPEVKTQDLPISTVR